MADTDTVTILKSEYHQLRVIEARMERLESGGGVDNWDWYGESLNPDGEPNMEEVEESIKQEVDDRTH